jgi:chemotaxis protein methyltransferase CheR
VTFLGEPKVDLTDEEFRLLGGFVYRYCGLHFPESTRFLIETRLQNRLRALHFNSFLKYYHYILFHQDRQDEIAEMVDVLTTNETYFFREQRQLDAFSTEILPELAGKRASSRHLVIWSAGCSTGEEPYTLAMLIDACALFREWRVEIIGTDISQRVLKTARRGIFTPSAFRTTPPAQRERYFTPTGEGKFAICEPIRAMVQFGNLNLLDDRGLGLIPQCDLIMCRNVIIYFDLEAKTKVMEYFFRKLRPGGYLLLGHSESLMNTTTAFRLKHLANDMVYQKPEDSR